MRGWGVIVFAACLAAPPSTARAQAGKQGQDAPPKPQPGRVHLGSTSVTVVDEHDTVDDVISRLRKAKPPVEKQDPTKSASATQTTPAPENKGGNGHEDGRAELRLQTHGGGRTRRWRPTERRETRTSRHRPGARREKTAAVALAAARGRRRGLECCR